MRTSRRSSPPPGLCLAALGVALALHACGRSSLDFAAGEPGASGVAGKLGATGSAGSPGHAGTSPMTTGTAGVAGPLIGAAGTVGAAGVGGKAGAGNVVGAAGVIGGGVGGEFGTAGTKADAGVPDAAPDATPIVDAPGAPEGGLCVDGTSECVDDRVRICLFGGTWSTPFPCQIACAKGVCTECVPGSIDCNLAAAMRICDANGVWSAPMSPTAACGSSTCLPGRTRCATPDSLQTCTQAGAWDKPAPCDYICDGDRCSADPKTVFVTSMAFQGGSLGGLVGADAICLNRARNAGLSGEFLAWLSDDTSSPATRFQKGSGPYRQVDGLIIANNWTQLTTKRLMYAIKMNEFGGPAPIADGLCKGAAVWSDTRDDGTAAGDELDCSNWTIPEALGASWGLSGTVERWTEACTSVGVFADASRICGSRAALYCFQQ